MISGVQKFRGAKTPDTQAAKAWYPQGGFLVLALPASRDPLGAFCTPTYVRVMSRTRVAYAGLAE